MTSSATSRPAGPAVELVAPAQGAAVLSEPGVVVVDARYWLGQPGRGREAYLAGHLPGARFVDVDAELAEPPAPTASGAPAGTHPGGRHPRPTADRLRSTVRRLGIDADSVVLAHDQRSNLASAWLWWLLRDAGFTGRVLVLDGGFDAWQQAGLPVEAGDVPDGDGSFRPEPGQLGALVADDVIPAIAAGHRLVDVRAAERFRGETEPVDPVAGHVPGAENLPATTLFTSDGRFLPVVDLQAALAGLEPGDVVSCGSGLTASQVLLAARTAGVAGLRLYAGSWSDWISDPTRPVTGRPDRGPDNPL